MNPAMLIATLESLRRRVRRLTVFYGMGVLLACVGLTLLILAALDWSFHLSSMWRLMLLVGGSGLIVAAIVRHLIAPLRSTLPLTDIAGRIEKVFPQFQDRLRSAVGFISAPTPDSPDMQRATIEQAVNLASTLPLRSVVDPRPALRVIAIGVGVFFLICIGTGLLSEGTRSILLARVFNPFTTAKWPRVVQIAMVHPIASRVPVGGRVEVEIKLDRGDATRVRPIVYYENDAGALRQEYLTKADDGRFTASLDARSDAGRGGSMKVWVVAGDDETAPARVQVVPRLAVESFAASIAAPAYANVSAPAAFDLLTQQADGLVGSGVELTLRFTRRIAKISDVKVIALDDAAAPAIKWLADDERTVRGTFRLDKTARFRVDATDVDGFPTVQSNEFEVVARPDQLPSATVENPRRSEERTPDSVVPLIGLVEDDVGVRDASLVVTRIAGGSNQTWTVPLLRDGAAASVSGEASITWSRLDDASGRSRSRVQYGWTLAALENSNLKPGDVLEYGLSVSDNYELDGQRHAPVDSSKLRISIISQDELSNRVADELRAVRQQVQQVKQRHDQTTGETDSFKTDVANKASLDSADATVAARLQQQQSSVASASRAASDRLDEIARLMEENRNPSSDLQQMAKDVSKRLGQAVEGSMKDAMQGLTISSQREAAPDARQSALERTGASQKQASAELGDALRRLDEVGSLNATIDQLQKMLDAQRALTRATGEIATRNAGKSPEAMPAGDRQTAADLAKQQAKLAESSAKALERLGKTADQLAKSDPESSDAMRAAQKQGTRQNVSKNQKQAGEQIDQNKSAKSSQQQAEAGLESMLNELQEAQTRKLAELQKKLAELQTQIDNLIRRQSGHNLDNLMLQGPEVVSANTKLIAELSTVGARKSTDAKPELGRLLAAQGQSERNARDIATKAADVPDGAEAASKLTRAATLMERAAVDLRDKKLAEAYEPPQLDALATLGEAKRLVDAQKQKADDATNKQQREAIRQAYMRIRGDEEKLADETKRIETARNAQGDLARADGIRLGQLPSEQGKLSDDIAKVGEVLLKLQSTVYTWANKQIAAGMTDVKADLAASKTATATQARQTQVLDDLAAMIENLKVDPLERKFESASGGGGGSGGGGEKPLPPEAELRLMRSLQERVNTGTKITAEAKLPEDPRAAALVALGRRQADIRKLLGEMVNKASNVAEGGEPVIPIEPVDPAPLPEEATLAQVDDEELQAELLGGKPGEKVNEIDVRRAADRMSRSHQRLEGQRDAGRVTQVIQHRIISDLDLLVEAARQQQGNCKGGGKPSPQDVQQVQKPSQAQPQNAGKSASSSGKKAAANSNSAGGVTGQANAGKDIRETAEEWGRISPRLRGPVLESRDETIVERYRRLIEDYTQAVGIQASGGSSADPSSPIAPTTMPSASEGAQ